MRWQQVLADVGLTVVVADADHVVLIEADHVDLRNGTTRRLVERTRPVHPSRIKQSAGGARALLAVPTATEATISAARAAGFDVVTDDGTLDLQLGEKHLVRRPPSKTTTNDARSRGPVGRSVLAVARVLLAQTESVSQGRLVDITGASQPTVSRSCGQLRRLGFLGTGRGIEVKDWHAMARWWLDTYPGAGGPSTFWFGLEPILEQVAAVARSSPGAAVSGSAAADLLSPWQRPDFAVVYTRSATPLTDAGLVPVTDPSAATLQVVAPADPSVWCLQPLRRDVNATEVALADPLQVAFDVLRGPDSGTRVEAVDRLLDELHGPSRMEWARAWNRSVDA